VHQRAVIILHGCCFACPTNYNKSLQRFSKRKFWTSKFTKNQKIDHLLHISLHGHSNEWWQTCNDRIKLQNTVRRVLIVRLMIASLYSWDCGWAKITKR